jgi:hypothetical protein
MLVTNGRLPRPVEQFFWKLKFPFPNVLGVPAGSQPLRFSFLATRALTEQGDRFLETAPDFWSSYREKKIWPKGSFLGTARHFFSRLAIDPRIWGCRTFIRHHLAKAIISRTSVEISGGRLAHASGSRLRQQTFAQ